MNYLLMTEDLKKIHHASMKILQNTGVKFRHPQVLDIIQQKGIKVIGETVFFTEDQVMEWVDKAPKKFSLFARNPVYDMEIGGDSIEYAPGYGAPAVIERDGTRRPALFSDYLNFLKLSHECKHFKCNGGILVQPKDVAAQDVSPIMVYSALTYSDKCLIGVPAGTNPDEHETIMDMLGIVFGGKDQLEDKPRIISIVNSTSPLIFDKSSLDIMLVYGKYAQPVMISPCPMAGTTAPVTVAGTIALANAETLTGIAVMQMIKQGSPVMYGWQTSPSDMRSGAIAIGSPERALMISYGGRLAKLYELPVRGGGADTDAKLVSVQSGYEGMMNLLETIRHKYNLIIHSAGILDGFGCMSYEQFIVDIEMIGMMKRLNRGVDINDETLAVNLINQVGPGGEFLSSDHTYKFCRTEHFIPEISCRGVIEGNANEIIFQNISQKKDFMLKSYQKPEMAPSISGELFAFLKERGIDTSQIIKTENND